MSLGDSGFGRYELVERLATRATSELFVVAILGEHGFRRHIVLKRLRDDTRMLAFIEDAKLAAKLSHPKVVQTLELGSIDDVPYVAMEYVDGIDLLGLLNEIAQTQRALEPTLVVWIAEQLLDALEYAHMFVDDGEPRPVVHGHLSPSKVLLGKAGEVKLCDFGVTRRFDLSRSGGQDYGHMAPEQVMEQPIDARSDVFGVGVLLAEMLMRKRLFAAHNEFDVLLMVRDVRMSRLDLDHVDPDLAAIVQTALAKRPEDRYQSAALFRDALDGWLFANRALGMNQRLAALVGDVRERVDEWRRAGPLTTPELDALPELGPDESWPKGSIHPATVRVIPPKSDGVIARGTKRLGAKREETPLARGTDEAPPLARPDANVQLPRKRERRPAELPWKRDAVPKPVEETKSQPVAQPRLVQRMELEALLPQRAPAAARQTTQLLTREQLAKAGRPARPVLSEHERPPDDGGDFARTPPLRVLFRLMRTKATGLLAVALEGVRKDIYVRDGQLSAVWSNEASDLFGNYLVAQKVLSDGELAMALATMAHYGGQLGETLVSLGLLDRMEVFRQLTRHAHAKVVDVCTWDGGNYEWYAGDENTRESFPLEPEAFPLLGEAALALGADVIDPWLAKHRDAKLVTAKTQRVPLDAFAIGGSEHLARTIDSRTLGDVVDAHPDPARAARILYLMTACDLVRFG